MTLAEALAFSCLAAGPSVSCKPPHEGEKAMPKLIGALAAILVLIVAEDLACDAFGGSGWCGLNVLTGRENHVLAALLPSS